ncbi:MAG: hypothetical protein ACLP6W_00870, partial [Bryobacteraceae bacterium]
MLRQIFPGQLQPLTRNIRSDATGRDSNCQKLYRGEPYPIISAKFGSRLATLERRQQWQKYCLTTRIRQKSRRNIERS